MFPKKDEDNITPIRPAETDTETGLTPTDEKAPMAATKALATDLLSEARDLIGGERARQHGDLRECHQTTARLWTAYLGVQITPVEVAQCLCLLKMARSRTGEHHRDSYRDEAGYAAIAGELAEGKG